MRWLAGFVVALVTAGAAVAEEPTQAGLQRTFAALRAAVAEGRLEAVLAAFPARGFTCTDEARDRADLSRRFAPGGLYHAVFFSSEELKASFKDRAPSGVSLRELLGAPDLTVTFDVNGTAGAVFLKSVRLKRTFSLLLDYADGAWWISDFEDC